MGDGALPHGPSYRAHPRLYLPGPRHTALCPQLAGADITAEQVDSGFDPGCVKTLRGITAPGILSPLVMRRAKKRKNLSSARHYDQIRFRFHTTKTPTGHSQVNSAVLHNASF